MKKTDILIVGGGPAGIVIAVTARKNNPTKKIINFHNRLISGFLLFHITFRHI